MSFFGSFIKSQRRQFSLQRVATYAVLLVVVSCSVFSPPLPHYDEFFPLADWRLYTGAPSNADIFKLSVKRASDREDQECLLEDCPFLGTWASHRATYLRVQRFGRTLITADPKVEFFRSAVEKQLLASIEGPFTYSLIQLRFKVTEYLSKGSVNHREVVLTRTLPHE